MNANGQQNGEAQATAWNCSSDHLLLVLKLNDENSGAD
jgi:hypothetical protein